MLDSPTHSFTAQTQSSEQERDEDDGSQMENEASPIFHPSRVERVEDSELSGEEIFLLTTTFTVEESKRDVDSILS